MPPHCDPLGRFEVRYDRAMCSRSTVIRIVVACALLLVVACSSKRTSAAGQPFEGSYSGTIQGTPATLTVTRTGERITGAIDAQGYRYSLEGQVTGTQATGTLTDPTAGGSMPFEATASGGDVKLVVSAQGTRLEMEFKKPTAGAAGGAGSPAPAKQPGGGEQRDSRLVGSWSYTEQLGDVQTGTALIVWRLEVRANGTFTYGNDRSQSSGHWRTRGNTVEVSEDQVAWEPYARFTVDGGTMLFTLANGSKQLWKRN